MFRDAKRAIAVYGVTGIPIAGRRKLDIFWTPLNEAVATLVFKAGMFALSVSLLRSRSDSDGDRAWKALRVFFCLFFAFMLLGGIESVLEVAGHHPVPLSMSWRTDTVGENLNERGYARIVWVECAPRSAVDFLAIQGESVYCVELLRPVEDGGTAPRPARAPICSPRDVLEQRLESAIALARSGAGDSGFESIEGGQARLDDAAFYLSRLRADPGSFAYYRVSVTPNDPTERRSAWPPAFLRYVRWPDGLCSDEAMARP